MEKVRKSIYDKLTKQDIKVRIDLPFIDGFFPAISYGESKLLDKIQGLNQILVSTSQAPRNLPIKESFGFQGKTFLDLGVFAEFIKKELKGKMTTLNEVLEYRQKCVKWIRNMQPDYCCGLDIPALIKDSFFIKTFKNELSINNYLWLRRKFPNLPLVLGLSYYTKEELVTVKKRLQFDPPILALCGQVPLILSNDINLKKLSLCLPYLYSRIFPHSNLHVYGAGGINWYPLIRLLGAKSADHAFWALNAGQGRIIGTNGSIFQYSLKKKIKTIPYLDNCSCWVCKNYEQTTLLERREFKMIHNLQIIVDFNNHVDEMVRNNRMKELIEFIKPNIDSELLGLVVKLAKP